MWYGQDMMWYTLLYEMIMFCRSYRQLAGALWLSLYCMKCKRHCFTLSLCVSDSCRSNSWRDDHDATMEITVSSRWRWWSWWCFGHGDQRHKMMMAISYHLYWLHVMFILYASYSAFFDGSIIRWSLTKFQDKSVLPEYAPLPKFFVPRHHVMIGCDKLYVHLQWVQASFAHAEYSG